MTLLSSLMFVILLAYSVHSVPQNRSDTAGGSPILPIVESPECKNDVQLLCSRQEGSDLSVISCLQRDEATLNSVSEKCQHLLWQRKQVLTQKRMFEHNMPEMCHEAFNKIEYCQRSEQPAFYVPCLIEHKHIVKRKVCVAYLNQVAAFVFADYGLMYPFLNACTSDIQMFHCGRIEPQPLSPSAQLEHLAVKSQGRTIECLKARIEKLENQCRTQIFRISELQSDDYHLDRPLYYACREDRERFCHSVEAGEGMVYACLKEHKYDKAMSKNCSEMITERQKLRTFDFFIDFRLAKACSSDIEKTRCGQIKDGKHPDLASTRVMLCLESAGKPHFGSSRKQIDIFQLQPECSAELDKLRAEMLDDYQLSPDLIHNCHSTMERYCSTQKNERGAVLHCLMRVIRGTKHERPPPECIAAVHDILKITNVQENVILDPVIDHACRNILANTCSGLRGHGQLFECLSKNLRNPEMSRACRTHLLELSYFVTRDVTLDEHFLDACHQDSVRLCKLPRIVWEDYVRPEAHLLTCLYNHRQKPSTHPSSNATATISDQCQIEVMRMVHLRAASVSLDPRVFEVCLADLAHCDEDEEYEDEEDDSEGRLTRQKNSARGVGMQCLQDRMEHLSAQCRAAVVEVSAEAHEDPNLDRLIMEACEPAEKRFCSAVVDPANILQCLIDHVTNPDMDPACTVAVRHMQIVAMKDFEISSEFRHGCLSDVQRYCKAELSEGPTAVLVCLSSQMTAHYLHSLKLAGDPESSLSRSPIPALSSACQEQIVRLIHQRSETTLLDPDLAQACKADTIQFCSNVEDSDAKVLKCLRRHRDQLSEACHAKLFTREELFAIDNRADYSLLKACKRMIKIHCADVLGRARRSDHMVAQNGILECLTEAMNNDASGVTFDTACRAEILEHSDMRLRDVRLDPALQKDCGSDIRRFCSAELKATLQAPYEQNGTVWHCLRRHFAETKDDEKKLIPQCHARVLLLINWENAMNQLDPSLAVACKSDLMQSCHSSVSTEALSNGQELRDCLVESLRKGHLRSKRCITELLELIEEVKADVHVDRILFDACSLDLHKLCSDITPGEGRQMVCLLNVMDRSDAASVLHPACLKQLRKRREMWNFVSRLKNPDSFSELVQQVSASQFRRHLMVVMFALLTVIFVLGLCCGRVTKRVPLEVKVR